MIQNLCILSPTRTGTIRPQKSYTKAGSAFVAPGASARGDHTTQLWFVPSPLASRLRARPRWRARRCGRGRLRRAAAAGRSPQGCRDPEGAPGAGEVLGGVALAVDPSTHHAIARSPVTAVFPSGCVYSVQVSSVFAS